MQRAPVGAAGSVLAGIRHGNRAMGCDRVDIIQHMEPLFFKVHVARFAMPVRLMTMTRVQGGIDKTTRRNDVDIRVMVKAMA